MKRPVSSRIVVVARVALLAVVLLASGCSGPANTAVGAEGDGTTGCIAIVAVDQGIRPMGGVTVLLPNEKKEASTDGDGRAELCGLAPGAYLVAANRTGYTGAQSLMQVEAGKTTPFSFTLTASPDALAYHQTFPLRGYAELSAGLATPVTNALLAQAGLQACTCTFYLTPDRPPQAIVLEATWTDSLTDPTGPTEYLYRVVPQGVNGTASGQMANPLVKTLNRLDFADPGFSFGLATSFEVSIYPDAAWPAAGQSFDVYATFWYGTMPPDGWSVLKGST